MRRLSAALVFAVMAIFASCSSPEATAPTPTPLRSCDTREPTNRCSPSNSAGSADGRVPSESCVYGLEGPLVSIPLRSTSGNWKHVELHHLAWSEVLSTAILEKEHRGVADPDQAYILGELIRYLEHPRSGALEFEDMGPSWVSVPASTLTHPRRDGQPPRSTGWSSNSNMPTSGRALGRLVAEVQYETAGQ